MEEDNSEIESLLEPIMIVASGNAEELDMKDVLFPIDMNKDFVIGRSTTADIDIPHPAISREHCVITYSDNKATLKNMSSSGLFVNEEYMKNKGEFCSIHNGDKIVLSKFLPDLCLKYYDSISYVSRKESKMLKKKSPKRKLILALEQNIGHAKKSKQDDKENQSSPNLAVEKVKLNNSYSKRLSDAKQHYDSQMLEVNSNDINLFSAEDIEKKTEEIKAEFLAQKDQIEAEYNAQLKELEAEMLELKSANEKLLDEVSQKENQEEKLKTEVARTTKENEDLKFELKKAEELIKLTKEKLEKESKDKLGILEQFKQSEEMKQEALKKCLEAENMKNFLLEANNELDMKHQSEMEALYQKQLELEKKISEEQNQVDKNLESESIIHQLQDELDSVRELLTVHESERLVLESEVQSKIKDFAEVLENEAQCTICSEIFVDAITLLGCFHTFCTFCIVEWKKQKHNCPICRQKIGKNQEKRNFLVDSWIRSFLEKMPEQMKEHKKLRQIRAGQTAGTAKSSTSSCSTVTSSASGVVFIPSNAARGRPGRRARASAVGPAVLLPNINLGRVSVATYSSGVLEALL